MFFHFCFQAKFVISTIFPSYSILSLLLFTQPRVLPLSLVYLQTSTSLLEKIYFFPTNLIHRAHFSKIKLRKRILEEEEVVANITSSHNHIYKPTNQTNKQTKNNKYFLKDINVHCPEIELTSLQLRNLAATFLSPEAPHITSMVFQPSYQRGPRSSIVCCETTHTSPICWSDSFARHEGWEGLVWAGGEAHSTLLP